jgi:hypothetical protein
MSTEGERIAVLEERMTNLLTAIETLTKDVQDLAKDVEKLVGLRNAGVGAMFALSLFGTIIIMGVVAFIKGVK